MKKGIMTAIAVCVVSLFTSCAHIPGGTDLGKVATDNGMINVTTGDGTFKDYKATGYHTSVEIGLAFGLPGIGKFMEVYPKQSNEMQMDYIAKDAKKSGANALINVMPPQESYLGFPLMIFGLYVDSAHGTGIKVK
jgi:hypothetical protein